MILGYAGVSTDGQTLDAQETALRAAGAERIFSEKVSEKQAALSDKGRAPRDRRYVVPCRRQYDRRAMHGCEQVRHGDKAASGLAPKGVDGRFDLYVAMNGRNDWHDE